LPTISETSYSASATCARLPTEPPNIVRKMTNATKNQKAKPDLPAIAKGKCPVIPLLISGSPLPSTAMFDTGSECTLIKASHVDYILNEWPIDDKPVIYSPTLRIRGVSAVATAVVESTGIVILTYKKSVDMNLFPGFI